MSGGTDHPPSFKQSLIAGAAAGSSVDLLFFPIDTVKTRLQSAQGFLVAGGFRGVYKGLGSVVVGSAPGAAAFFVTYDTLKHALPAPVSHPSPLNHSLASSAGECVACLVRVPTEVVKSRMQTSAYGTAARSSLDVLRYILRNGGLSALYRGFGITIMREIPFTSLQFPMYEFLKRRLSVSFGRSLRVHEAAVCGSVAGGFAAAATTPLDVLKTRVMLDMRANNKRLPSIAERASDIYRTGGLRAFSAGLVPRTLWISAGGSVFLGVYEFFVAASFLT